MRILAIDSSSGPASAAVVEDGKILAEFYLNTGLTHSQTLMPLVQSALQYSGTQVPDAIAVSAGPGSFTGVRIAIAGAKGLAMGDNLPCVGISSLETLAYNFAGTMDDQILCTVMDARCEQAYRAFFSLKKGVITRLTQDQCLPIIAIAKELVAFPKTVLLGDCSEKCFASMQTLGVQLAPPNNRLQRASSAAFAAIGKQWGTAAQLQPIYLQQPQAQRELKKRLATEKEGATRC